MTTWIKLCGLSTDDDVATAVECGVQAVGFVFAKSARRVSPDRARQLADGVPSDIATVAVMLRPTQAEVDEVLAGFVPDFVQADWQALQNVELPERVVALPVYRQGDGVAPADTPSRFVYEGAVSGEGQTLDWPAVQPFTAKRELILAGGLHPGNVREAMRVLTPFGVDVSSGIERERGVKDPERMRAFVTEVRACESTTVN